MARPKTKNLSIFEMLEKGNKIDYSEYSMKDLSETIQTIYKKYVEEKNRKISLKDLENIKKLCDKLGESVNELITTNNMNQIK